MAKSNRIAVDILQEALQMDGIKSSFLSSIFSDEPPPLNAFLYDSKYLNHMRPTRPKVDEDGYAFKLSPIQWDFIRNFEQIFLPELYIAMVEEFGEEWAPKPTKNMFALAWGKGSQSPETPIYNRKSGTWTPLRDFKAGPVAAIESPETGNVIPSQGTDSFKEGEGRMFLVTTNSGKKMKVWEGHRFLSWGRERYTPEGNRTSFAMSMTPTWRRLWDMEVGDHVAVSNTVPEPENIIELPDWEVEWTGLMIGDGCMTWKNADKRSSRCSLVVGYQAPVELNHAQSLIEAQGLKATCVDDGVKYALYPSNGKGARGKSNPMVELQGRLGLAGCNAYSKHIPKEFFSLSNRQIALLVSRLIDTDGWVSISNTVEVGYSTASEQLADDYINLLLRLGVIASKTKKMVMYKGERRPYYQVRVRATHRAEKLLKQLTLLDKEPARLAALEWLKGKSSCKSIHGNVEWDRIESIEYVGWGEYWTLSVDGPANYISNGGIVDHNSGKDTVVRLGVTRIASLLGHMKSPQSYFNMASFDEIHLLNVATSAAQAKAAFFEPMKTLFKTNDYLASMFHGDDPADGSNTIRLKNNIRIISGNSIAGNQEGLNILAGVADEISEFKTAEEFKDVGDGRAAQGAEAIIDLLRSSGSSRFPKTYKVAQISWTRFQGDAILKAVAQGNESIAEMGDRSPWYVSGPHATWEVKPGLTKSDFDVHFKENPERAAAMYECKPPKSTNVFIRDESAIDLAFEEIKTEPITPEYYWGTPTNTGEAPDGATPQEGWQVRFLYSEDFAPIDGALYTLHGDMAIRGDRAGIAMSHIKELRDEGDEEPRPIIANDFTFAFESDLSDAEFPREIQLRWYRQLIWELVGKGFQIEMVSFDQFQSSDMTQSLNAYGINTVPLSLDRNDKVYQTLKDIILDGRLRSYRVDPNKEPLVVRELKRLRRKGKKVDHLPGQSKDAADALAGSVFNALEVGGEEDIPQEEGDLTDKERIMYDTATSNSLAGSFDSPNPFDMMNEGSNPFESTWSSEFNPFR